MREPGRSRAHGESDLTHQTDAYLLISDHILFAVHPSRSVESLRVFGFVRQNTESQ